MRVGLTPARRLSRAGGDRPRAEEPTTRLWGVIGLRTPLTVAVALLALGASFAFAGQPPPAIGPDLVVNGNMESDADGDGLPDGWQFTPHRNQGTMTTAPGHGGGKCLKMTGLAPPEDTNGVLVAQYGTCAVQQGKAYRVTFWARAQDFAGDMALVALQDTDGWQPCGLRTAFVPGGDWREYSSDFIAERTCGQTGRLQFWFVHTGSLFIDDVSFVEVEPPKPRLEHMLPPKAEGNLIPNSSFELDTAGWGSWSPGGRAPSALLGELDTTTAADGRTSLRLRLDRASLPVFYFDYFDCHEVPLTTLCAGHVGWAQLQKAEQYVLSAYLRAQPAGAVGVLYVQQQWGGGLVSKSFVLTADWQRYELPFQAQGALALGLAGLDLEASKVPAATLWVDAVQLEKGSRATAYAPRDDLEAALMTDQPGNIVRATPGGRKAPLTFRVLARDIRPRWFGQTTRATLTVRDFADQEVFRRELELTPGQLGFPSRLVETRLTDLGYYRAQLLLEGEQEPLPYRDLRCAIIRPYPAAKYQGDSRFGINHAYPWPEMLELGKLAGITWARDWSLKWQTVEPQPGQVDFTAPDHQIDRVLKQGLKVLPVFPFPSSSWSSEAGPQVPVSDSYPESRRRMAFMPRDLNLARQFMERSVRHFQGRITHWQILNEPYYTSYSLPRDEGYTPEDYAKYLKVAYAACKAGDPKCLVLGGYGAPPGSLSLYQALVAQGGLDSLDLMDIHIYPGAAPPEAYEASLQRLRQMAAAQGKGPPLWLTETGYYADDDPPETPVRHWSDLLESEEQCGAYMVRFAAIMFANGVEKIFYHSGVQPVLTEGSLECQFLEYGNVPRKQYAVQAALANWFTPNTTLVEKLKQQSPLWGYLFRGDEGPFAVTWTTGAARALDRKALGPCRPYDLFGNALQAQQLTLTGTPLFLRGPDVRALEEACERLMPAVPAGR